MSAVTSSIDEHVTILTEWKTTYAEFDIQVLLSLPNRRRTDHKARQTEIPSYTKQNA